MTIDVPVLIVGGGPVGLSLSIMLSRHGIKSLLVERHPSTSIHPKARNIHARTMEIFRQYGVEQDVLEAALPPEQTDSIVWVRSLAGEEIERRTMRGATEQTRDLSPSRQCFCAQDELEPVLRAYTERLGVGELRFSTECIGFRQDVDGITATLRERQGGTERTVRARYLVAADGADSGIRRAAGIRMIGREAVYESVNILLRADLSPWTAERPAALYFVDNPAVGGTFLTINGRDRWGLLANDLARCGRKGEAFTPEFCVEVVRAAAGVPDLPVEILGIQPWTAAAQVAERYRDGRLFLAGDAAHHLPPTGGFGMNTGIQDVHNLAWKLAGVLDGWANPALLDTYEAERLPVGRDRTEQSLVNAISMGRDATAGPDAPPSSGTTARPEYLSELGLIFGAVYDSAAIVPDGTAPVEVANPVADYRPNARPGSRAPHLWLTTAGGEPVSAHDLCALRFALVAGPAGRAWRDETRRIARASSVPLEAYTAGPGGDLTDPTGTWAELYGVDADGAVLIRPDGHVAWRSRSLSAAPTTDLAGTLGAVLGRAGPAHLLGE